MPVAINLLPTDLAPKGILIKIGNALRSLVIAGFVIFFVFGLGIIALSVVNSFQINSLNARQNELKEAIKSLETTEQRFVLISDRVDKAKTIYEEPSATASIDTLFSLVTSFSSGVTIRGVEVDSKKTSLTVSASDSTSLAQFMANMIVSNFFGNIRLSSFSFNPGSGYLVSLEVSLQ